VNTDVTASTPGGDTFIIEPPRQRSISGAFLAQAATLWIPGLGHLLSGRIRRGLVYLIGLAVLDILSLVVLAKAFCLPVLIVTIPLVFLGSIIALVDATACGLYPVRPMIRRPALRVAAAAVALVACYMFQPSWQTAMWLREHYVETLKVMSSSMAPTLVPGDCLLLHKKEVPQRWSIVAIRHPEEQESIIVERLVGLPGEMIEISNNTITVDGKPPDTPAGLGPHLSMSYLGRLVPELRGRPGAGCTGNPIRLGPDEYYLLGDNSAVALDSRLWERAIDGRQLGAVPANRILGRVTAIYWPPSRWRIFNE